MQFTTEIFEEINVLSRFNLNTSQEGIKVHSTAAPEVIAATKRLFGKGLITQEDGGYLTSLGITSAEHTQNLLQILQE